MFRKRKKALWAESAGQTHRQLDWCEAVLTFFVKKKKKQQPCLMNFECKRKKDTIG